MDTYSFLRQLADSWVLLAMTLFYVGAIVWAFRPGARQLHADIANIPLRDDPPTDLSCTRNCSGCTCGQALTAPGKETAQ